jgi:hypothetical protein
MRISVPWVHHTKTKLIMNMKMIQNRKMKKTR